MLSTLINIILLILCCIGMIFFWRKIRKQQQAQQNVTENKLAQEAYHQSKFHKSDNVELDTEQKTELSWQFLVAITKKVINFFSSTDQQTIHRAGEILVKHGAYYQHNIDEEVKLSNHRTRTQLAEKSASQLGR